MNQSKALMQWFPHDAWELLPVSARYAEAKTNMESQSEVHARKLLLRVEVRGVCYYPPTVNVSVNIPYAMLVAQDVLGVDLLKEDNFEVGRLGLHVVDNKLLLIFRCRQHCSGPQRLQVRMSSERQSNMIFADTTPVAKEQGEGGRNHYGSSFSRTFCHRLDDLLSFLCALRA